MKSRRSGLSLLIVGLIGGMFFCLTDPVAIVTIRAPLVRHHLLTPDPYNLIDAFNEGRIGTIVGIAGSTVIFLIGLWLLRRPAI